MERSSVNIILLCSTEIKKAIQVWNNFLDFAYYPPLTGLMCDFVCVICLSCLATNFLAPQPTPGLRLETLYTYPQVHIDPA